MTPEEKLDLVITFLKKNELRMTSVETIEAFFKEQGFIINSHEQALDTILKVYDGYY